MCQLFGHTQHTLMKLCRHDSWVKHQKKTKKNKKTMVELKINLKKSLIRTQKKKTMEYYGMFLKWKISSSTSLSLSPLPPPPPLFFSFFNILFQMYLIKNTSWVNPDPQPVYTTSWSMHSRVCLYVTGLHLLQVQSTKPNETHFFITHRMVYSLKVLKHLANPFSVGVSG